MLETAGDRFGQTLAEELSKLRAELATQRADISHEIATAKVAILKWSFVFWLGQILVIVNVISWMLHGAAAQ